MRIMKLGSFALVAALAAGSAGCVVRATGAARFSGPSVVVVEEDPPPPRSVYVESRPGYVFIQGRWERRGSQWAWRDGYWERERAGHYWTDGRWDRRGNGWVWVEGRWSAGGRARPAAQPVRGNGNVRDHRRDNRRDPGPPPNNGPVIRDHRR